MPLSPSITIFLCTFFFQAWSMQRCAKESSPVWWQVSAIAACQKALSMPWETWSEFAVKTSRDMWQTGSISLITILHLLIVHSPPIPPSHPSTLMAFGQFLASNYDPLSQVYLAYQLWHSILSCCKLPLANKAAQSVLKKQIYRTYLRHDSTRRVELPKHTVAQIQSYVAHYVPDLSTLRTIQMAAADIFAEAISDFQVVHKNVFCKGIFWQLWFGFQQLWHAN